MIALALFLTLTAPDGRPVTIDLNTGMVILPIYSGAHCAQGSNAIVTIGTKTICVKETPEEIERKLHENSDK